MIRFDEEEIKYLAVELPDEIKFFKYSGDFEGERAAIAAYLKKEISFALKRRLDIEDVIAEGMLDDYNTDFDSLLGRIKKKYPACGPEHLEHIIGLGNADYIRKNGVRYFQNAAASNIFGCNGHYLKSISDPDVPPEEPNRLRRENLRIMREKGERAVRITVEEKLSVDSGSQRPGRRIRVHLPYPCDCPHQTDITLLDASHPVRIGKSAHCTAFIEVPYLPGDVYSVRFAYTLRIPYFRPDPSKTSLGQPSFFTGEQPPHIRFTPAILALAKELKGGETNRLVLAGRAYEWVTTHVVYSYMREYLFIDNIPEFAMMNGRGDCGVQALLFITLCRAMGVPARWQSGSHVRPDGIGSHDWAQFYVEPWGWMWCDPSFGGGALRSGDRVLWNHYFCNLDVFREINCTDFQQPFDPPKKFMRRDPYDNQSGEAEYEDAGLGFDTTRERSVISFEELI